jgi:hypothetical protein
MDLQQTLAQNERILRTDGNNQRRTKQQPSQKRRMG